MHLKEEKETEHKKKEKETGDERRRLERQGKEVTSQTAGNLQRLEQARK